MTSPLQRPLAALLLAGSLILLGAASLHPVLHGSASDHLQMISDTPRWRTIHLLLSLGTGLTIAGIWACEVHAKKIGAKDPSECVIDEVAGQWIALVPIAIEARVYDWRPFVMAFFLFRLFDITKPWPIAAMEKLEGGLGIMADDVVAGLFAALALYGMLAIQLI